MITHQQALDAYRTIQRAHPELRKLQGPAVLTGLERMFGNDTEMACADVNLLVINEELAVALCAKLRGPRVTVVRCPDCKFVARAWTQDAAEAKLSAHTHL